MHTHFGDIEAYNLFNTLSAIIAILSSLFYYKSKQKIMGLHSRYIIYFASRKNEKSEKAVKVIFFSLESILMGYIVVIASNFNKPFGDFVGTGFNYFGLLSTVSIFWFVLSAILVVNPLKQIDIAVMFLPVHLFFVKLACFFQGCCYGIPWEYGPYNYVYGQNQVPVQLIEAFWALLIFIFLIKYRKKAKTGTMFPIYVILYCSTRFFSEFLRREENVLWIFKTYHLLCLAGIAVALLMLLIVKLFGDKISAFFEKPHTKFDLKIAEKQSQCQTQKESK